MSEDKPSLTLNKKFVSQDVLEEQRRKRQEEWEKVRQPDQPQEAPEEVYDPRSLYDRLQEQKQRKDDEHDAQFALKNQVKGLEDGEVDFLDYVSDRQMEIEKERKQEVDEVLSECRNVVTVKDTSARTSKPVKSQSRGGGQKSQSQLLAGAVKRKSSSAVETEEKKSKLADSDSTTADPPHTTDPSLPSIQVVGVLPGLGVYSDSDISSDSSTSDDEPPQRTVVVVAQKGCVHS